MPSVLKAGNIFIDHHNVVQIKSDFQPMSLADDLSALSNFDDELAEPEEQNPEELIAEMLQNAYKESESIVQEANQQAKEVIENAKLEAEALQVSILAEARAEAAKIKHESTAAAYKEGIELATQEGNEIKAQAQATLDAAIAEQAEMRQALEPDAVNLIIDVLEKLLGNIVDINPNIIVALIRSGFAGTTISGNVTVRVSEKDYPEVISSINAIKSMAGGTSEVEIVKDFSLSANDCIIETPFGGIDVSLTPQFNELRENLIYLLENR
ncbi:MAG: FliH/SctL family protein [Firmicutes bacterium]|nr:FliH/SctL family protein [Bacillota bacterium]